MRDYKVCVMGSGGVGKSTITVRFVHDWFVDKYDPTIEDSYRRNLVVDGLSCSLEILDTAGLEQFASLTSMYLRSADGILLVFDLCSTESLHDLAALIDQIRRSRPANRPLPMVLVGNKCDRVRERQVPRELAIELAQKWGSRSSSSTGGDVRSLPYYETSAKRDINVTPAFQDITRQIIKSGSLGGSTSGSSGMDRPKPPRRRCLIL